MTISPNYETAGCDWTPEAGVASSVTMVTIPSAAGVQLYPCSKLPGIRDIRNRLSRQLHSLTGKHQGMLARQDWANISSTSDCARQHLRKVHTSARLVPLVCLLVSACPRPHWGHHRRQEEHWTESVRLGVSSFCPCLRGLERWPQLSSEEVRAG